jgi:ribosomal protein S27E
MTSHFVTLYCANCGGKLEVYDDMERFSCGSCGTGLTVQRRGGTVTLGVAEAFQKIQNGAPAAGELPLARLQDERQKLTSRREAIVYSAEQRRKLGFGIGVALLLIGFLNAAFGRFAVGFIFFAIGILTVKYVRRSGNKVQAQAREINAQIDLLESLNRAQKPTVPFTSSPQ